jgi:hypothetical protein
MRSTLCTGALLAALVVAGCGGTSSSGSGRPAHATSPPENSPPGDIPDNQAYVAFAPPQAGYTVKVPEGWARTTAGGAVTFTDKLNSVRLEAAGARALPSVTAVKRTVLPQIAHSATGYRGGAVSTVRRTAGRAIRITYLARAKPDPVTGRARVNAVERYLFVHRGREAVLTLSGPKGADNVDPWRIITDSLRWTG